MLHTIASFLDDEALAQAFAAAAAATGTPAAVFDHVPGGRIDPRTRSAEKLAVDTAIVARLAERLASRAKELQARFGTAPLVAETPQFLRYRTGDFFVAHQDGNTPLIHDDSRFRRVSVVVPLSAPGTYGGGALLIHGTYPDCNLRQEVRVPPGTLVAFPSETTHEVTPVTHGERLTVVSWYRVAR
ncbi:MAG TPA: 2OG-Fe(II) oxygenase [Thermoanaerobaculia bacterium]|nr:2OG-Fe(II) oxygenase [Thermoanaerobaculia bacterium]